MEQDREGRGNRGCWFCNCIYAEEPEKADSEWQLEGIFLLGCKWEYWKYFQRMINVEGKKGNDRNKCRLSSRYSKAGCYHQIINSPQWCWGHFNKPIQGGLLLLGIMISGSTVFYMNNGGYILQQQSLLELFYVCWYIWHFSLIIAKWVVDTYIFIIIKNPKPTNEIIRALQISVTEKMGKHPKTENT